MLRVASSLVLWLGIASLAAAQQPVKLSRAELMKQKLQASEKILEGLALEDYEAILRQSQRISLLTLEESWNVLQTVDYRRESEEFRRAVDALSAAAKQKNLDGAALAYMQVTLNCVRCHKYLRSSR
jgi:cytochrome c556